MHSTCSAGQSTLGWITWSVVSCDSDLVFIGCLIWWIWGHHYSSSWSLQSRQWSIVLGEQTSEVVPAPWAQTAIKGLKWCCCAVAGRASFSLFRLRTKKMLVRNTAVQTEVQTAENYIIVTIEQDRVNGKIMKKVSNPQNISRHESAIWAPTLTWSADGYRGISVTTDSVLKSLVKEQAAWCSL